MSACFGSGPVVLGILDHGILPEDDRKSNRFKVTKVGGVPNFLPHSNKQLVSSKLKCVLCNNFMSLYAQIYIPLEEDEDFGWCWHRSLFVFACPYASCQNKPQCIRALRGISVNRDLLKELEVEYEKLCKSKENTKKEADSDWNGDEWNQPTSSFNMQQLNDLLNEEDSQCKTNASNPVSQRSNIRSSASTETFMPELIVEENEAVVFPAYALYDELERRSNRKQKSTDYSHEYKLLDDYENTDNESDDDKYEMEDGAQTNISFQDEDDDASQFSAMSKEVDSMMQVETDVVFHAFYKRVMRYPKQLLRYCLNGNPLLCSRYCFLNDNAKIELLSDQDVAFLQNDMNQDDEEIEDNNMADGQDSSIMQKKKIMNISGKVNVPPCHFCGSPRRFEMQLMPGMIHYMLANMGDYDMDWGTILIYTCQKNCAFGDYHKMDLKPYKSLGDDQKIQQLKDIIQFTKSLGNQVGYYDEVCILQPGV